MPGVLTEVGRNVRAGHRFVITHAQVFIDVGQRQQVTAGFGFIQPQHAQPAETAAVAGRETGRAEPHDDDVKNRLPARFQAFDIKAHAGGFK